MTMISPSSAKDIGGELALIGDEVVRAAAECRRDARDFLEDIHPDGVIGRDAGRDPQDDPDILTRHGAERIAIVRAERLAGCDRDLLPNDQLGRAIVERHVEWLRQDL